MCQGGLIVADIRLLVDSKNHLGEGPLTPALCLLCRADD